MAHVPVTIRVAHVRDLPLLIEIERLAGSVFRSLGMDLVADDDPGSADELAPYAEDGRAFVAVDATDRPMGYLLVDAVDGAAHIEQVSVLPEQAGRRIGSALIEHAGTWHATVASVRSHSSHTWKCPGTGRITSASGFAI